MNTKRILLAIVLLCFGIIPVTLFPLLFSIKSREEVIFYALALSVAILMIQFFWMECYKNTINIDLYAFFFLVIALVTIITPELKVPLSRVAVFQAITFIVLNIGNMTYYDWKQRHRRIKNEYEKIAV